MLVLNCLYLFDNFLKLTANQLSTHLCRTPVIHHLR